MPKNYSTDALKLKSAETRILSLNLLFSVPVALIFAFEGLACWPVSGVYFLSSVFTGMVVVATIVVVEILGDLYG